MYRTLWSFYRRPLPPVYALNWVPHEDGTILAITSGFAEYVQNLIDHGPCSLLCRMQISMLYTRDSLRAWRSPIQR